MKMPVLATLALLGLSPPALAGRDALEEVVVWARPLSPFVLEPALAPLAETNTALLLRRVAGANVNFNGTLAGIAQYRGMYGDRVNIDIDGMNVGNACSNNMDAPLHYLPRTFVDSLEVVRGIAPVSGGLETIGGNVVARSRSAEFGDSDVVSWSGRLAGGGQSVDGGYAASSNFVVANNRHSLRGAASREQGNNRDFGDGTIRPSRYERNAYDVGYAMQAGQHTFGLDYRRNDTGRTGTPALPMDDIYSDADLVRGRYGWVGDHMTLDADIYWTRISHLMSNYRMRAAMPGMSRDNLADAETLGWHAGGTLSLAGGEINVGMDGNLFDYDADTSSPDSAMFFVQNFSAVARDRYGAYAEWVRKGLGGWDVSAGARWTHVTTDAGTVDASMVAMMPPLAVLRDRFNMTDRSRGDDNIDVAGMAAYALADDLTLDAGIARKNRAPGHQERYLWVPLEATGGLSDGNLYLGDVGLDPETAWQFELGLDWHGASVQFTPRAFYHHVDDYIQGVPATDQVVLMVAAMNGDPTPLQYANVDARLWGADAGWGWNLAPAWRLEGIVSWVRGERRDVVDDLFRIAPLNGLVDLVYRREQWSMTLEGEFYASQHDVSATNGERASAGYGLLNLYGQYSLPRYGIAISGGVENLLDKTYRPHLNGMNRVAASDVPLGVHIPGDGVNVFVQLGAEF